MLRASIARLALLLVAVACGAGAFAAAAAPAVAPLVMRSALLRVTAIPMKDALALRVSRIADHEPVTAAGAVSASLDGHPAPVKSQPDGTYLVSTSGLDGGKHSLAVVVRHDGVRELLTGTVSLPQTDRVRSAFENHGMAAWWVLNIVVILIALAIISRRKKT